MVAPTVQSLELRIVALEAAVVALQNPVDLTNVTALTKAVDALQKSFSKLQADYAAHVVQASPVIDNVGLLMNVLRQTIAGDITSAREVVRQWPTK